jgi:hypothetical protein
VNAIMIRVMASLLPDDIDTLVPMDRSFGGKVVAAEAGGSGKLGLIAAWRTFPWRSRFRLVGTVAAGYVMFSYAGGVCILLDDFELAVLVPGLSLLLFYALIRCSFLPNVGKL